MFYLIGGLLCLGGGLFWWRVSVHARRNAVQTTATVIASDVQGSSHGYFPCIRYRYRVEGDEYTNDQLLPTHGRVSGTRPWAKRLSARFPQGRTVVAWYLPHAPQQAFLMNKREPLVLVLLVLGVVLLALGIRQLL